MWSFQVMFTLIITPSNFAHWTDSIEFPSIHVLGNRGHWRLKLMLSSFALSHFYVKQICLRPVVYQVLTRSWALLCWPLGIVFDAVVSSTYFHVLKMLGTDKSLMMRRKIQWKNLVPWGTLDGTLPHSENSLCWVWPSGICLKWSW